MEFETRAQWSPFDPMTVDSAAAAPPTTYDDLLRDLFMAQAPPPPPPQLPLIPVSRTPGKLAVPGCCTVVVQWEHTPKVLHALGTEHIYISSCITPVTREGINRIERAWLELYGMGQVPWR